MDVVAKIVFIDEQRLLIMEMSPVERHVGAITCMSSPLICTSNPSFSSLPWISSFVRCFPSLFSSHTRFTSISALLSFFTYLSQ